MEVGCGGKFISNSIDTTVELWYAKIILQGQLNDRITQTFLQSLSLQS